MVKNKKGRKQSVNKPPSRIRYEKRHRVRSFRLDMETDKLLTEHLDSTGCSFTDFVKGALGREKAMVEKRVEILALRQMDPSHEDRLRCLENLFLETISLTRDDCRYPPLCPRCEGQELFRCEGRETESTIAHPWVFTWKCPKCGYFINTYKRIDPKSIRWIDPDSGKYIDKPITSTRHWRKKQ